MARANQDDRVLVTKDADFEITYELGQGPPQLLLITTGNIHNNELLKLFVRHEEALFRLLAQHEFIELSRNRLSFTDNSCTSSITPGSGEKDIHAFAESRRGRRRRTQTNQPAGLPADAIPDPGNKP